MTYSDPNFVANQYRDASNLQARIALHRRFSVDAQSLQRWEFDQLGLSSDASVLGLGCGPGYLWAENLDRIPEGWTITLTDASPGMLREAEDGLGPEGRFEFRIADARGLPFPMGSFDAVVANHMLYHVPDLEMALSEIARVLRPGGTLYAATNGKDAHRALGWMLRVLDPSRPTDDYFREPLDFSLENGTGQLSPWFSDVSVRRFRDALVVTEPGPLVDYLVSGRAADDARRRLTADAFDLRVPELIERLEGELASSGEIRITKDVGMFVARK
ncbi:MAG: class I SAM-dependent methyltransferase [Rubrobacter sp.]